MYFLQNQAVRYSKNWALLMMTSLMMIAGCASSNDDSAECGLCDLDVVNSRLYAIGADLDVYRALKESKSVSPKVGEALAIAFAEHIVALATSQFALNDITGRPLESLCYATTDEAKQLIELHPLPMIRDATTKYLSSIGPEVRDRVAQVQANLLGHGCNLAPK